MIRKRKIGAPPPPASNAGRAEPKGESKVVSEIIDLLIQIPIFDDLDGDELRLVVRHMNVVRSAPGEIIFKEGDRGDFVCFVVEGQLDVLKRNETGKHVVLSSLTRGRSMGEMSLLDNFPRSASIQSRTKSVMVTLSREGFEQILETNPRIGIKMLKGLARLLSLSLRKTSSRLADYMLPLS